jgi:hypothetical protein
MTEEQTHEQPRLANKDLIDELDDDFMKPNPNSGFDKFKFEMIPLDPEPSVHMDKKAKPMIPMVNLGSLNTPNLDESPPMIKNTPVFQDKVVKNQDYADLDFQTQLE